MLSKGISRVSAGRHGLFPVVSTLPAGSYHNPSLSNAPRHFSLQTNNINPPYTDIPFGSDGHITVRPTGLEITHPSFSAGTTFPFDWLRDSSLSLGKAIHPTIGHKLHSSHQVKSNVHPTEGGVSVFTTVDGELNVRISWQEPSLTYHSIHQANEPNHISDFPLSFLQAQAQSESYPHPTQQFPCKTWTAPSLSVSSPLFHSYNAVTSSPLSILKQVASHGIAIISDVPTDNDEEIWYAAEALGGKGGVRRTFYGDMWDVVNEGKEAKNVAYTNHDLGLHMDLLYFQNPPGVQLLHMLENNNITGGKSYFVDAFKAAERLYEDSPHHFHLLATTPIPFKYQNGEHNLHWKHPTIELSKDGSLLNVNYSPPFQGTLPLPARPGGTSVLEALRAFANKLEADDLKFEIQLKEGDLVVFNNRRIVHARTSFSAADPSEYSKRWLKGCYIESDAMWDRLRVLKSK